jgi:hypothetical protein
VIGGSAHGNALIIAAREVHRRVASVQIASYQHPSGDWIVGGHSGEIAAR